MNIGIGLMFGDRMLVIVLKWDMDYL